ncbi:MAG: MipA/OmpV family protein [Sneathiella sp.]|uniref:MipA/OmpV family protein n=1 Tax=Sneathiella sp. TaxID=1964365 RepID=UPI00300249B3
MRFLIGSLVFSLGVSLAGPTFAETSEPEVTGGTDLSGNYLILGLGVGYAPEYLGADDYEFILQPSVNAQYENFFLNTRGFGMAYSGFGYNVINENGLKAGPLINLDLGRDEDQSSDLRGLGDIGTTLLGGGFVEYQPGNWWINSAALFALAGDAEGFGVNVSTGYDFRLSKRLSVTPFIGTTWVSKKYSETYFGINDVQSARSGLAQYNADSGFNNYSVGFNARYALTKNWVVLGITSFNKLGGSAKDSPLTKQRGSDIYGYGSVSILYKF